MANNFTLFVNSSDSFSDCWSPYFTLLCKYWPRFEGPILLNTELSTFEFPGISIASTRVQCGNSMRLSWSECLLAGLGQVETPLVLYMQEDYFLEAPVMHAAVEQAAKYMLDHPEVAHIGLTKYGSCGPFSDATVSWMKIIGSAANYRISTQAGLWRVESLLSYVVPSESGWMFEIFGTIRSWYRNDLFFVFSDVSNPVNSPIAYPHTGIIKGRWNSEVFQLFLNNSITVDFTVRGVYRDPGSFVRRFRLARSLLYKPLHSIYYLGLYLFCKLRFRQ